MAKNFYFSLVNKYYAHFTDEATEVQMVKQFKDNGYHIGVDIQG